MIDCSFCGTAVEILLSLLWLAALSVAAGLIFGLTAGWFREEM